MVSPPDMSGHMRKTPDDMFQELIASKLYIYTYINQCPPPPPRFYRCPSGFPLTPSGVFRRFTPLRFVLHCHCWLMSL